MDAESSYHSSLICLRKGELVQSCKAQSLTVTQSMTKPELVAALVQSKFPKLRKMAPGADAAYDEQWNRSQRPAKLGRSAQAPYCTGTVLVNKLVFCQVHVDAFTAEELHYTDGEGKSDIASTECFSKVCTPWQLIC